MRALQKTTSITALLAAVAFATAGWAAPLNNEVLSASSLEVLQLKSQANPKISSELATVVNQLRRADRQTQDRMLQAGGSERITPTFRTRGADNDELEVYIWLETWNEKVLGLLNKSDIEIVSTSEARYMVQAWVPLDQLEAISEIPGVRQIRRPSYGIASSGSIVTQGDSILGTDFLRSFANLDGHGVVVGMISTGLFNNVFTPETVNSSGTNRDFRVSTGNIPGDPSSSSGARSGRFGNFVLNPLAARSHHVENFSQDDLSIPEGAAMLEVLHDIAPGAGTAEVSGYYGSVLTDLQLTDMRSYMLDRGVNVLIEDLVFFDAGRFDGTSIISREAQRLVTNNNVVLVNAVGNFTTAEDLSARSSSAFSASTRSPLFINGYFDGAKGNGLAKFHNFASGRDPSLRDELFQIFPQSGQVTPEGTEGSEGSLLVDVVLVWDDVWDDRNPRAADDLDLYLMRAGDTDLNRAVATSLDIQENSGVPYERITYFAGSTEELALAINRKDSSTTNSTLFTLIVLSGSIRENQINYLTHGVPLNNGDALAPVLTVGGVNVGGDGIASIDRQTSPGRNPGPGRALKNDFISWYENQPSPAVVSYTNVNNYTVGNGNADGGIFSGSSAAAAHIGGLMTLLRAGFPDIPSYEFYNLVRDTDTNANFPNASLLESSVLSQYINSPSYYRVNGFDTWANINAGRFEAEGRSLYVPTYEAGDIWVHSDLAGIDSFNAPVFEESQMGLRISPGGQDNVFGFWETGLLEFTNLEGELTTELRSDRLYEITVQVGSDETDPTKVPVFRLRTLTGTYDEAATLMVSGVSAGVANAPRSIGGKEYKMYYRPTSDAVAKTGMQFSFDLIHINQPLKNADASLYIKDFRVSEMLPKM